MNRSILQALVWKETRQTLPTIVLFMILSFLWFFMIDRYFEHRPYTPNIEPMKDIVLYGFYFMSLCLVFFLAAGNRLIESANRLDTYLLTKPVDRRQIYWTYFTTGLMYYGIWGLIAGFQLLWLFGFRFVFTIHLQTEVQDYYLAPRLGLIGGCFLIGYTLVFAFTMFKTNIFLSLVSSLVGFQLVYLAARLIQWNFEPRGVSLIGPLFLILLLLALLGTIVAASYFYFHRYSSASWSK